MTVVVNDADFTLYQGDVRAVLAGLEDGSVDCVVCSPPYWGLRDYGTGLWDGGDPDCDHERQSEVSRASSGLDGATTTQGGTIAYREQCGRCGARRVDQQLGLEPTPDLYVANMVAVFREVRRVLAAHGTCWVNLGDSYWSMPQGKARGQTYTRHTTINRSNWATAPNNLAKRDLGMTNRRTNESPGLKHKDLVGIPWRVAFALQADGWYLRSDIIWAKPNPMPESVTDRPTKAHEYVFLLTKSPRYWFDQEAVREPHKEPWRGNGEVERGSWDSSREDARRVGKAKRADGEEWIRQYNPAGRNVRSVWEIATQPYPEAHFATYPEELVRRCILAGCPEWVCRVCGKPRERIVERESINPWDERKANGATAGSLARGYNENHGAGMSHTLGSRTETLGWSDCGHNSYRPGVVLDPFIGSGTTALVARRHGRHTIGVELNPAYCELAARRLSQLSLLAEEHEPQPAVPITRRVSHPTRTHDRQRRRPGDPPH